MQVRIPYRPNKLIMFGVIIVFGFCALAFSYLAIQKETGLSLFRVVSLDPEDASIAFWVMCSVSTLFIVGALFLIYASIANPKNIVFTDSELIFPKKGFSQESIVVIYADISRIKEVSISGTHIYTVYHSTGKLELTSSMVPGEKYYEQFKTELVKRVNG